MDDVAFLLPVPIGTLLRLTGQVGRGLARLDAARLGTARLGLASTVLVMGCCDLHLEGVGPIHACIFAWNPRFVGLGHIVTYGTVLPTGMQTPYDPFPCGRWCMWRGRWCGCTCAPPSWSRARRSRASSPTCSGMHA